MTFQPPDSRLIGTIWSLSPSFTLSLDLSRSGADMEVEDSSRNFLQCPANDELTINHKIVEVSNAIQVIFQTYSHFSLSPVPFIDRVSSVAGRRPSPQQPPYLCQQRAKPQQCHPPACRRYRAARTMVAFVKDGNIQVWDEATGQTRTIFDGGDAIGVSASDDGQVLAFLRRSAVQLAEDPGSNWREQSSLWAIDRDGNNLRELVSADALRSLLDAAETESTNIPQMEWIPGTHRLLYSAWRYIVQAEGESHAVPQGLFVVDADSLSGSVLMPAGSNLRFVPSPDGQQIALMSPTGLSFINTDGSDLRSEALSFPEAGSTGPLLPTGHWTQDSGAFVIVGSFELDPEFNISFTLWKVPVDGSPPEALATIDRSDPRSVTFSPDGRQAAFAHYTDQEPSELAGWSILSLPSGVGPLAVPPQLDLSFAGVHWSPEAQAFNATMRELCPGATSDSEVCDSKLSFNGSPAAIRWLDTSHFLLLTREPSVLFLVTLDASGVFDATSLPIVAWPLEDLSGLDSFTAVGNP